MSQAETIILKEVRQRHEQAPTNWIATHTGDECTLQAHPPNSMGKTVIHEDYATMRSADMEAIALLNYAHHDIGFLLGLIKRASETIKALKNNMPKNKEPASDELKELKSKQYAAECAMLCDDPDFQKYLTENYEIAVNSKEAATEKVKQLLDISSRKQLNTSPQKAHQWRKIVIDFQDRNRLSQQQESMK